MAAIRHAFFRPGIVKPIIIASHARDAHADSVLWGLSLLGHEALLWQRHLFPAGQSLSMLFEPGTTARHRIGFGEATIDLAEAKTVWDRRSLPLRLDEEMDPRDLEFARRESEQHLDGFLTTACPDALWVNPPGAARLDTNKPFQIALARRIGFTVPPTLFSNAPAEIADFYGRHGRSIVYKSYRPERWTEVPGGKPYVNHSAAVTDEDLGNERALAMCPGIFQARVGKAFELRVTVMGDSFFCVRIDPSPAGGNLLDWRSDKAGMRLSEHELPENLRAKCRAFMAEAGLVFGCFDFIVTPDGEQVFLEVNPMGQFLWQEEKLSDLPLLDAMCGFLVSADPHYRWEPGGTRLRFAHYRESKQAAAAPRAAAQ